MNISKVLKADYLTEVGKFKYVVIILTDSVNKYSIGLHINNDDAPRRIKRLRLKLAFDLFRETISRVDFKEKAILSE